MWFSIDVNGKHLKMIDFHRKRFSSDRGYIQMWEADRFIYLLKPPPWIINSTYVSLSTSPPFSEYRMNAGGDGGGGYRYRWCWGHKRLINPAPALEVTTASAAGILIPAASSSREDVMWRGYFRGKAVRTAAKIRIVEWSCARHGCISSALTCRSTYIHMEAHFIHDLFLCTVHTLYCKKVSLLQHWHDGGIIHVNSNLINNDDKKVYCMK